MKDKVLEYLDVYKNKISHRDREKNNLPGGIYFYNDEIMASPRDDGDCRYPYGEDGFNYWTYASGYIHCNEGLFSPFLRSTEGGEPKISFFVGHKNEGKVKEGFSILSVPVLSSEPKDILKFTVFATDATYYISESESLISAIRTFVSNRQIVYSLYVFNKSDITQNIFTSSYFNPFLKNSLVENSTDRWFRQMEFVKGTNQGSFRLETYEEKDRGIMATNYGSIECVLNENQVSKYSATTSRYEYVGGSRSSLHSGSAVINGELSNERHHTSFTETGICGDIIDISLDKEFRVDYIFSYTKDVKEFHENCSKVYTNKWVDESLAKKNEKPIYDTITNGDTKQALTFTFKDSIVESKLNDHSFNPFMKHLKKQVEFCSEIKGFVQLSNFSLIGIRDVFQAIEGYMFDKPEKAKAKMLEALSFTDPSGRLPRQYSLPKSEGDKPAMDLRPFIDQGVWVISTILTYLRLTKDYEFLFENCGYYEIVDEDKHVAIKSDRVDSVFNHMIKIMDYLIINRDMDDTKCVLALYGDWNDALDGLGKSLDPSQTYGTGVSVMATLQVYQNLDEMTELFNQLEVTNKGQKVLKSSYDYTSLSSQYKVVQEEIKNGLFKHAIDGDRLIHGWGDKRSYKVGSLNDPDGLSRDGLTSNAFWILSGLIKQDDFLARKDMILQAYRRLDSKYGMKTFEPYFEKGTVGVGRIPNLPKGTAENGATYIHASMFAVMSLFAVGESKLAWQELLKLIPLTHETVSVSPYVVPNSYGLNEEFHIDGESMQDWQTGSSNVMLKTIIRYVIGFEPQATGICIQPSLYQIFNSQEMVMMYLGRKMTIKHVTSHNMQADQRRFFVNDKEYEGVFDHYMNIKKLTLSDTLLQSLGHDINIRIED